MAGSKRCFWVLILLLLVACTLGSCKTAGGKANVVLVNPPANAIIVERDFSDITRYPGATLVKPQEIPLEAGTGSSDWARWEVAIYTTGDPINEVFAFYEQEMPSAGWRGQWKPLGGRMLGSFSKDEIVATISVSPGAEATSIVIVRAIRR